MTLHTLIAALSEIERQHGPDVPVCHHDDWSFFVVERVAYVPADAEGYEPAHVAIEGETTEPSALPGGARHAVTEGA